MKRLILRTRLLSTLLLALFGLASWITIPAHSLSNPLHTAYNSRPALYNDSIPTTPEPDKRDQAQTAQVSEAYGKLPLSFDPNNGQLDSRVRFASRGSGYNLYLTSSEAVLTLRMPDRPSRRKGQALADSSAVAGNYRMAALRMKLVGANPSPHIEGVDRLASTSNYFLGSDAANWRTGVPNYARVHYKSVYPGIDLTYYGNQRQLEYDFVVAPGASAKAIKLAFKGARRMRLDGGGDLVLSTAGGELRQHKPVAYQEVGGAKQAVAARYVVRGKNQIGFEVGPYDRSKPLIIDPILSYSTFLGGTGFDDARSIAIDSEGNAYVAGITGSFNFPTALDSFNTTFMGSFDAFITKLNQAGSGLIYSTYLGGSSNDSANDIAIDSSGNAYVTGETASSAFPTTPGAFRTSQGSSFQFDAFVTKLNSTGTSLIYSTYLGGTSADLGHGIAADSFGSAYITGTTFSSDFPTKDAYQPVYGGHSCCAGGDAFVTKLNAAGSDLIYSTFLGGSSDDLGNDIVVNGPGNAYVIGSAKSSNFPTTDGAYQTTFGGTDTSFFFGGKIVGDAFITKLSASGTELVYSTYLGGIGEDGGTGIALDSSGNAYVTGGSFSSNFPTTSAVLRVSNGGATKTTDGGSSWTAINKGLTGQTILSLAIDPGSTIYAGTDQGGIFKSTNGGGLWSAINTGLTSLNIRSVAVDPATPSTVYLGTGALGIFKSTDSGASWKAINTGQNGMGVNAIVVDPVTTSTLYAGTSDGVSKSTNGGANWTSNLGQLGTTITLGIAPSVPATIYAGLAFSGVHKSTDGGMNWSPTALTSAFIRALAVDPTNPATVYASTSNSLFKSTDGGSNWSIANKGLRNRTVNSLAIEKSDPTVIYAGTTNGVYRSSDSGGTWTNSSIGLAGAVINALAIDPLNSGTIYSGAASGSLDGFVTKLDAAGESLVYSTLLGGSSNDNSAAIAIDLSGSAYVTGYTESQNFPTTPGLFGSLVNFDRDVFLAKLNASATALAYSTLFGGNRDDRGSAIAVDSSNSAYVAGFTGSPNFPTTEGAYQRLLGNSENIFGDDAFVSKFVPVPSLTADVEITLSGPSATTTAGSFITYTITVKNKGPEIATSILVTDHLPPSLIRASCSGPSVSCTSAGNSITFNLSSLGVDESATLHISAEVNCLTPDGATVNNVITVESSSFDTNASNDSAMSAFIISNPNPAFTLIPSAEGFPVSGGSSNLSVAHSGNCTWTAFSNDSWIDITFSSNCCNGSVFYTVEPNTGPARTGTMTIAGQTFTVTQAGCSYSIAPPSQSFSTAGGSGSLSVTTTSTCAWTAVSNSGFVTITSGSNGTGNGTVSYSVAPNNTPFSRTGTLTVAGQTFIIIQSADTDGDGIPDVVEAQEGTNPSLKDNDIFNNARWFVQQQYRDFLAREADPDGITFWTGAMSQGLTRAQVADNFFNSAEFQGTIAPIARLYFSYFLRIPDFGGVLFWADGFRNGQPLHVISENFAQSSEFQQRYGSLNNIQFVTLVYQNVLGRTPAQVEIDYWVGHLDAGRTTRGLVMLGFSESNEFKLRSASQVAITITYIGMLRRTPVQAEIDFWASALNQNPDVARLQLIQAILNSAEYHNRFLP